MEDCRECGMPNPGKGAFCTDRCRTAWHNRRKARGAELYDFVMAWRFERGEADTMAMLARLASAYRDADNHVRDGRKSWDLGEATARVPLAFSPKAGDGR